VKVDLFTSGCPFQDVKTGLYKNWRIPLIVKTRPLPLTQNINDDDPAIRYTGHWLPNPKRGQHDYNDDVHYTKTPGDAAELAFTGTGIAIVSEKFADHGSFDVFIDGQARGRIDTKQTEFPRLSQITVFSAQDLPDGPHSIRIVNSGPDNIVLDAFAVTGGPLKGEGKTAR